MICHQTSTQSHSESSEENPNLQPSNQPQEQTDALGVAQKKKRHPDYLRNWRKKNKDREKQYRITSTQRRIKWAKDNPVRRKEIALNYYYRTRPPLKPARQLAQSWRAKYTRSKRLTDVQFLIKDRLRASTSRAFRRQWIKKPLKTEAMLGCTLAEAKAHLEAQFTPEMSWDNRASFVIDHHVPIAIFDLRDSEEVAIAFCWKNLRPETRLANAKKSDTVPSPLPSWLPPHIAERILIRSNL